MEPVGDPNCKWSPDAEDACSYCNGEDCRLCSWSWEALRVCEHAIDERHMDPPRLTNVRQSDERLTRRKARKLARERGSYERAADIRAAGLTGFIARRSTRRGGGWWATLRPYAGSSPARSPRQAKWTNASALGASASRPVWVNRTGRSCVEGD